MSKTKQSYLTDGGSNLKTVPMALHIAFSLLTKNTDEEIDEWKIVWEDVMSGLGQVATLMDQSVEGSCALLGLLVTSFDMFLF